MSKITVTVRAPSKAEDHVIVCESHWSIQKLKEVICETYPGKPNISCQRLIHGGRYLLDNEILGSCLQVSNSPQIVHLVLTDKYVNNSTTPSTNSTPGPEVVAEATSPNELRHRNVAVDPHVTSANSQWPQPQTNFYQPYHHSHSTYYGYSPQQHHHHHHQNEHMNAMWHHYQQQWSHYMQHYHAHYHQATTAPTPDGQQAAAQQDHAAPAAPVRADAGDGNPAMNAQGGFAAAEEDELQRDWLDVLFVLFRYVFFFSIVFFYSSFWRFFFVAGLVLVFYVYQAGVFRAQRRRVIIELGPDNQPAAQQQNPDDNNNENADNIENDGFDSDAAPVEPPPPTLFATAWCFIQTFFTSLIPQPPPVM